jgi:hypothetical protein
MPLNVNDLKTAVHEFNADANNVAWDTALHQAVASGRDLNSIPLVVFSVNYFWSANVQMERGALLFYCENLFRNLDSFRPRLRSLRSMALPVAAEEELRAQVIEPACDLLVDLLGRPNGSTHFAFATKLMLWLTDKPAFDSRLRTTILNLTGEDLQPKSNDRDELRKKYAHLICLYNGWLTEIRTRNQEDELIEYDWTTQPDFLRCRNTVVRIVDKYLWLRGTPRETE